jgi:hypothetical protein
MFFLTPLGSKGLIPFEGLERAWFRSRREVLGDPDVGTLKHGVVIN